MIPLFILIAFSIYAGGEFSSLKIGHFNKHFEFLEKRAKELGWEGKFGEFRKYQFVPLLSLRLIDEKDFAFSMEMSYWWGEAAGNFSYFDTFLIKVKEKWDYKSVPFIFKFYLKFKYFNFFSGAEVIFTYLNIDVKSSYKTYENYPQIFRSHDVGLFLGVEKSFKNLSFEIFMRNSGANSFTRGNEQLFFSDEGYIYKSKREEGYPAILDYYGFGLKIFFRILDIK